MTKAQKAAGKNFPRMFENTSAVLPWNGGSEASPTWKKSPVKMLKKKTPGQVVKRESKMVKVRETNSKDQRGSLASHSVPEWKVNDEGKFESNPTLSIWFLLELA
jgi:hypothetical protein